MFDNKVFDLVKKKIFYLYEYMNDFERFKEQSPSKGKVYILFNNR